MKTAQAGLKLPPPRLPSAPSAGIAVMPDEKD